MSEQAAHEPTMEEILASIRRIISEDDAPAEEAKSVKAEPESEAFEHEAEEDHVEVSDQGELDTDDIVFEAPEEINTGPSDMGDLDILELTEPVASEMPVARAPESKPEPQRFAPEVKMEPSRGLISESTAQSALSHFGQLSNGSKLPAEGRSIEDLVVELLQPMLKQWLDQNLAGIVEDAVRSEVERLARQARR